MAMKVDADVTILRRSMKSWRHCRGRRKRLKLKAMFQSFDDTAEPQLSRERIAGLRQKMRETGIDAYVVPRADEFQGEYVAPGSERLRWLTGFSGSAGSCLITQEQAILFADGRYTIQARQQVDPAIFTIVHSVDEPMHQWVAKNLAPGSVLAYDPWLITADTAERLRKACEERGATLRAVEPISSTACGATGQPGAMPRLRLIRRSSPGGWRLIRSPRSLASSKKPRPMPRC
jgi:hypothetical protein